MQLISGVILEIGFLFPSHKLSKLEFYQSLLLKNLIIWKFHGIMKEKTWNK